jgi:hypothetical protein
MTVSPSGFKGCLPDCHVHTPEPCDAAASYLSVSVYHHAPACVYSWRPSS